MLYLRDNKLTGSIPPELADLPHLEQLLLGPNDRLSGCVPEGLRDILDNFDYWQLRVRYCD